MRTSSIFSFKGINNTDDPFRISQSELLKCENVKIMNDGTLQRILGKQKYLNATKPTSEQVQHLFKHNDIIQQIANGTLYEVDSGAWIANQSTRISVDPDAKIDGLNWKDNYYIADGENIFKIGTADQKVFVYLKPNGTNLELYRLNKSLYQTIAVGETIRGAIFCENVGKFFVIGDGAAPYLYVYNRAGDLLIKKLLDINYVYLTIELFTSPSGAYYLEEDETDIYFQAMTANSITHLFSIETIVKLNKETYLAEEMRLAVFVDDIKTDFEDATFDNYFGYASPGIVEYFYSGIRIYNGEMYVTGHLRKIDTGVEYYHSYYIVINLSTWLTTDAVTIRSGNATIPTSPVPEPNEFFGYHGVQSFDIYEVGSYDGTTAPSTNRSLVYIENVPHNATTSEDFFLQGIVTPIQLGSILDGDRYLRIDYFGARPFFGCYIVNDRSGQSTLQYSTNSLSKPLDDSFGLFRTSLDTVFSSKLFEQKIGDTLEAFTVNTTGVSSEYYMVLEDDNGKFYKTDAVTIANTSIKSNMFYFEPGDYNFIIENAYFFVDGILRAIQNAAYRGYNWYIYDDTDDLGEVFFNELEVVKALFMEIHQEHLCFVDSREPNVVQWFVAYTDNELEGYEPIEESGEIIALKSVGNRLYVFKRDGIWAIDGILGNQSITKISKNYGCVSRETIQTRRNDILFLSEKGICIISGNSVRNLSFQKIQGFFRYGLENAINISGVGNALSTITEEEYKVYVPFDNETGNKHCIVLNLYSNAWYTEIHDQEISTISIVDDDNSIPITLLGDKDGEVFQDQIQAKVKYEVLTKTMDMKDPMRDKIVRKLYVLCEKWTEIIGEYRTDDNEWTPFMLNQDASKDFVTNIVRVINGKGKTFQLRLIGNEDKTPFQISGFEFHYKQLKSTGRGR